MVVVYCKWSILPERSDVSLKSFYQWPVVTPLNRNIIEKFGCFLDFPCCGSSFFVSIFAEVSCNILFSLVVQKIEKIEMEYMGIHLIIAKKGFASFLECILLFPSFMLNYSNGWKNFLVLFLYIEHKKEEMA